MIMHRWYLKKNRKKNNPNRIVSFENTIKEKKKNHRERNDSKNNQLSHKNKKDKCKEIRENPTEQEDNMLYMKEKDKLLLHVIIGKKIDHSEEKDKNEKHLLALTIEIKEKTDSNPGTESNRPETDKKNVPIKEEITEITETTEISRPLPDDLQITSSTSFLKPLISSLNLWSTSNLMQQSVQHDVQHLRKLL